MKRITTAVSLVAVALWLGALPAAAADEPPRMQPAPAEMPSADRMQAPRAEGNSPSRTGHEYVVREGDTLAKIAEQELGAAEKWTLIAKANGIDDPRELRVGQKLMIPRASL
jgi:nucleoid-associated protein YgaU